VAWAGMAPFMHRVAGTIHARSPGHHCPQKVVLADVDLSGAQTSAEKLKSEGHHAAAVQCDVTQQKEIDAAIQLAVSEFGSLDIAIANAGIVKGAPFLEMTEEDFDAVIDINLKGTFLTCQVRVRKGGKRKRGARVACCLCGSPPLTSQLA
jgi:NAD(P)-dependent dehydrogenase (short-subunit alcohol dehydrogenase family)